MKSLTFNGGQYAFALPDGGYGVLFPGSHIDTHLGRIALPADDVLFLVGTSFNGALYMAGQGHNSGNCWLYGPKGWQSAGPTFGVSPCAFGTDTLYVVTSGSTCRMVSLRDGEARDLTAPFGSQGIRYIRGISPVSGDDTYRDGDYFEFTERGNVRVGQGAIGGAIINGRLLETGECRFIRFERSGDQLAIAIVQPGRAVLHWLTVSEIASLPVYGKKPDDPPPPDKDEPEKPVPVPDQSAFVRSFLSSRLKRYASLEETRINTFAAVNACCVALRSKGDMNWGVLEKMGGDRVRDRAADILLYALGDGTAQVVDVVNDAEGSNGAPSPSWNLKDIRPISQWRQPYAIEADDPPHDPPPDEHKPDPEVGKLRAEVKALREVVAEQEEILLSLVERVTKLEAKPDPVFTLPELQIVEDRDADTKVPPLTTGSRFGHSHPVRWKVVPK